MAIYAIGDLHLSFGQNKPMDIFGDNWINHEEKIKENWINKVKENDTVILPGDFSWAINLEDTIQDFKFLSNLPGKKILLKGNHDYWWTTLKKMRDFLINNNFKNIDFLYNNSFCIENRIIAGTKGGAITEETSEKILRRENIRLKLSIQDGLSKFGSDKEIIVCMHYPPFIDNEKKELNFISTMKEFDVKKCIYGHIHRKRSPKRYY